MKTCLFTVLNDAFLMPYKVFMKSFFHYNKWFMHDIVVIDTGLSMDSKKQMLKIYPRTIFKNVNEKSYKNVNFKKTDKRLQVTYYFLEAFCQYEYDRVVSLDVDMIVLGDLNPVFQCKENIAGCKMYAKGIDDLVEGINAGVFVVNKRYLNEKTYNDLLAIARQGFSMPEQKTMNIYFKGKYHYLDKVFNVEKRMMGTKRFKKVLDKKRVLHYVGQKPWDKNKKDSEKIYEPLERIWWEWHNKK